MNKLKQMFNFSLAEILAISIEILLIGLLQMVLGYGDISFLVSIYVISRLHPVTRKLVQKVLTRV